LIRNAEQEGEHLNARDHSAQITEYARQHILVAVPEIAKELGIKYEVDAESRRAILHILEDIDEMNQRMSFGNPIQGYSADPDFVPNRKPPNLTS